MTTAYADSSAIVKLVVEEPESAALARVLGEFDEIVTSRIGLVETRRAARRGGVEEAAVDVVAGAIGVIELDDAIAATAGRLEPPVLRTLDAIHIAAALAMYRVDAFLTYDERLADAARAVGLVVASPA